MAYEFGSKGGERLNVPNPLKVENLFLLGTAAVLILIAVILLILVRGNATSDTGSFVGGFVISLALLGIGISMAGFALAHLRFFFGREEPVMLGDSGMLSKLLYQRALEYPVPSGPLNGLLYSWIDDLIFSPPKIQSLAQVQFRNAATMLALLLSLLLTMTLGKTGITGETWLSISNWIGLGFIVMAMYILMSQAGWIQSKSNSVFSRNSLKFLIAFAVAGPVVLTLVGSFFPTLTWIEPYPGVFILLVAAIGTYWLFFHALMGQLQSRPQTEVSFIQEAWSIRCQPTQIMDEFDRAMQETWTEAIPNRRYAWKDPIVNLNIHSGKFDGAALEETQPMPVLRESIDLKRAWSDPSKKRLVMLDINGAVLSVIGAILLSLFAYGVSQNQAGGTFLIYGVASLVLGLFSLWAGHNLWLRFDFESRVQWITLEGNYTAASMEHGNTLNDTIKTKSQMVQIESMTFRLWSSRLRSVTFGKGEPRFVTMMTGESEFMHDLAQRLRNFAQNHAAIVAPTSMADLERHAQLAQMNKMSRAGSDPLQQLANAGPVITAETATPASDAKTSCPACHQPREAVDIFCRHCGARVIAAGLV